MCLDCGCDMANRLMSQDTAPLMPALLADNDMQARRNRSRLDRHAVLALNLMSSPGSGKTSLLEATAALLANRFRMAVIEGDLATENDAARLRERGVPAVQITTGSACHLDAAQVERALAQIELDGLDFLFIENVGNLVCPASFDLGQHRNITLLSTPEGDDKPAKYPVLFRATDLLLLSKADLLPVLDDFRPARAEQALRNLANPAPVLTVSARRGTGMEDWCAWLRAALATYRAALSRGEQWLPRPRQTALNLRRNQPPPALRATPPLYGGENTMLELSHADEG